MVFTGILSIWFYALYWFYKKDQPKEQADKSDSDVDVASEEGDAPVPNAFANPRARAEEEKLDREEIKNNQAIREMENILKDSNRQNLNKKEVLKMEKKLEKAQMQA